MKRAAVEMADIPEALNPVFSDFPFVDDTVSALVLLGPLANAIAQIVGSVDHPGTDVIRTLTLDLAVGEIQVQVHPAALWLTGFNIKTGPFAAGQAFVGFKYGLGFAGLIHDKVSKGVREKRLTLDGEAGSRLNLMIDFQNKGLGSRRKRQIAGFR